MSPVIIDHRSNVGTQHLGIPSTLPTPPAMRQAWSKHLPSRNIPLYLVGERWVNVGLVRLIRKVIYQIGHRVLQVLHLPASIRRMIRNLAYHKLRSQLNKSNHYVDTPDRSWSGD